MKIFVCVLLYAAACSSLPHHGQRIKKEVASGSDSGENLIETSTKIPTPSSTEVNIKTEALTSTEATSKPISTSEIATVVQKKHEVLTKTLPITPAIHNNGFNGQYVTQTRIVPAHPGLHADEFKVRILDLSQASGHTVFKTPAPSIHIPFQHGTINSFNFPGNQFYSSSLGSIAQPFNFNHFTSPIYSVPSFYQYPTLTPQLTSYDNLFGGISYPTYPSYPIISQEYPVFGGQIPVLPETGITQGFEFLHPQTIGLTDEKIDHEGDSVSVEAIGVKKTTPKKEEIVTAAPNEKDPKPDVEHKSEEAKKE